jgi:hypothetical protein
MSRFQRATGLVAGVVCFVAWHGSVAAQAVSPNDAARFLAGMQPSAGSPAAALTRTPTWQRQARWFDANWATLEARQLSKVRAWSNQHLKDRKRTLHYMFSGPDFLYADAFFPDATNYLMSGLEPVGAIPVIGERTIRSMPRIQSSIASSLQFSFFITKNMKTQLQGGDLSGTLPILYVYIARAGKTIREVTLINLDRDGAIHAGKGEQRGMVPGVKIVFATGNGPPQTLYYFRTDVSNGGVNNSGFLKFAATLGTGNALLKSASYLMHSGNFTQVRDFVLQHSLSIVQDDSGIPLHAFKPDMWDFHPFGKYLGPISIFPGRHQPRLAALFRKAPPLQFGIGYRHRGFDSNLLLAVKKKAARPPEQASEAVPKRVHEAAAGDPKLRPTLKPGE